MKAILEKIPESHVHSFEVEFVDLPCFISPLHFHNEIEINLVVESTGTLIAGDKIRKFKPGDIALLGCKLPHVYMNDQEYTEKQNQLRAKSIVFKFREDILGTQFMDLPEVNEIKHLLIQAKRGLFFYGWTRKILSEKIIALSRMEGFDRIIHFLSILNDMARSSEFNFLASEGYANLSDHVDCERIDKVYKYIISNFHRPIELSEVADVASMCEASFCRYFKSRTTKTFTTFLNEVRVGYACKLLIEKNITPLEVCYKSGYNYPSNFHKQFKRIKGMTPLEYRKKYRDG